MSKAKIYIYRNLNRGNLFSLRRKGIVIRRWDDFLAFNCIMKVSEAGRKRVLLNKKRNVHAFVVAEKTRLNNGEYSPISLKELKYNPYKQNKFICNEEVVENANIVLFKDGRAYIID